MGTYSKSPSVIIVGAGPSGIVTAHELKHKLGFNDFLVYEKLSGVGGTWIKNTYPGCGCDIPSHLYSFSFNLNPDWSADLVDQEEILQYMNDTVDKFGLREHMNFENECTGAKWNVDTSKWEVEFLDIRTGVHFRRYANILISAVGAISYPKHVKFKGLEKFKGEVFHTAEWNHEYDYRGKRMAVIGNGCSAAQVVPNVIKDVAHLKQYARGAQWYHERPNRIYTSWQKWQLKYLPLYNQLFRLYLFVVNDSLVGLYSGGKNSLPKRLEVEKQAKEYIYAHSPEKYHKFIAPDFPLGCKRRIWDPGYLDALFEKNLELVPEGITEFDETGIVSEKGTKDDFDVVIMATGFEVTRFLTPMEIIGTTGTALSQQWDETRGAQAYYGTFVHDFPNFAILFGPNTFPAHNSALFAIETQMEYITKVLFKPVLDQRSLVVDVKHSAEERFANKIQLVLENSVYEAGCSNWYINEHGRNVASWPGYAFTLYLETFFPKYQDFNYQGGASFWFANTFKRWLRTKKAQLLGALILVGMVGWRQRRSSLLLGGLKSLLTQANGLSRQFMQYKLR